VRVAAMFEEKNSLPSWISPSTIGTVSLVGVNTIRGRYETIITQ